MLVLMEVCLQLAASVDLPAQGSHAGCLGPAATTLLMCSGGARAAVAGPACVTLLSLQPLAVQAQLELPKVKRVSTPAHTVPSAVTGLQHSC